MVAAIFDNPFVALSSKFEHCIPNDPKLEMLSTGGEWVEGPVWLDRTQEFIWSDIPNNRMMSWSASRDEVSVFREPSDGANGNTTDRDGRLVTCEQYSRRITRTEMDGTISVLVETFGGKRFNAPNDVVVKSDGSIWFTDPDYGVSPHYQGERELSGCHVYCYVPQSGETLQMTEDMIMPNGLAFSSDEKLLYIVDTGSTHVENGPNHIRRFHVGTDLRLSGGEVFAKNAANCFDGVRVDQNGWLWCGAEDGVHCYDQDGGLVGKVITPKRVSNLCFGEADRRTLFLCATDATFRCRLSSFTSV